MKKILFILSLVILAFSCGKNDGNTDAPANEPLNLGATLSINLRNSPVKSRAYSREDSALLKNIIRTADEQLYYNFYSHGTKETGTRINDKFRDTVNLRFLYWGDAVIVPSSRPAGPSNTPRATVRLYSSFSKPPANL